MRNVLLILGTLGLAMTALAPMAASGVDAGVPLNTCPDPGFDPAGLLEGEPRLPIHIHGDADLTSDNGVTGGSGTADDPFVIAGWHIVPPGGVGILVEGTTAHVRVQGNVLHALPLAGTSIEDAGIRVVGVENLVVERNLIVGTGSGVSVRGGDGVLVQHNKVSLQAWIGIEVMEGSGHVVQHNTTNCSGEGIIVMPSTGAPTTITANIVGINRDGIVTMAADGAVARDNHIFGSWAIGFHAVQGGGSAPVDARGNYWDSANGPAGIGGGDGDVAQADGGAVLLVDPWLTAPAAGVGPDW